ncbi:MAG: hypothetical protein QOK44_2554, partial [Betaproteobacteria bacterium]|nr:hypothetical protein [Betaproteobacteria bacterium]
MSVAEFRATHGELRNYIKNWNLGRQDSQSEKTGMLPAEPLFDLNILMRA